jgi:hypothetical protein
MPAHAGMLPMRGADATPTEKILVSYNQFPPIIAELPLNANKKLSNVQYLRSINEKNVEGRKIYCIQ